MSAQVADYVRGKCRVIAVNNQGIKTRNRAGEIYPAIAPWADVLYAADRDWWRNNESDARSFAGLKVTIDPANGYDPLDFDDVHILKNSGLGAIDDRPTHLCSYGNSGGQAINLAYHFGSARIILLGFDMKPDSSGKRHWFGEHHFHKVKIVPAFAIWISRMQSLTHALAVRGVELINCTPASALTSVPYKKIEDIL